MNEINTWTASQMADAINQGDVSAEEVTQSCIERISEREDIVKAWAFWDPDLALKQARACDEHRAAGNPLDLLHGVPVGLKDIIDTADMPTESGSDQLKGRRPSRDATSTALLRAAGAIILGKTVTTEFAMTGQRGTHNPHDTARTPGGSSSGSGAGVADFMVPLALGSQTGGSMLRPASFCGVHGYKPTYGSISRHGVFILARALDHLGIYARSLKDVAMAGDVLMVRDPRDFDMRAHPNAGLLKALAGTDDSPLRLAFIKGPPWAFAEPYMDELFGAYIDGLGDIPEVTLGGIFDGALEAQAIVMNANVWMNLREYVDNHEDQLQVETVRRIVAGRDILAADYIAARELTDSLIAALDGLFEHYDALITAAAPGEAPVGLESTGNAAFQRIWTLTGLPTMSLPLLKGPNGMPIGVQVIGKRGRDADLMRAVRWVEEKSA
ncbi:MAG: amidase [Magnetovibrio sp.]|nr:amidase [Magnetovibrio sp.]